MNVNCVVREAMSDDEVLTRRKDELDALNAIYGADLLPSLSGIPSSATDPAPNGPWFIQLVCNENNEENSNPTLEIQLPNNYPVGSDPPTPILHNVVVSTAEKEKIIQELLDMFEPQVEIAIMWAEHCRQELETLIQSAAAQGESTSSVTEDCRGDNVVVDNTQQGKDKKVNIQNENETTSTTQRLRIVFLSYNHLLHGPSHKKESQIVSIASAMRFVGFIVYGTPGIVGLVVNSGEDQSGNNKQIKQQLVNGIISTDSDVHDFIKECGKIGKRCSLCFQVELTPEGFPELSPSSHNNQNNIHRASNTKSGSLKKKRGKGGGISHHQEQHQEQNTGRKGVGPLLTDLVGNTRVEKSSSKNKTNGFSYSILKSGLTAFPSCTEFKEVLMRHGANEELFRTIIGI